jgi:hypothetical protein
MQRFNQKTEENTRNYCNNAWSLRTISRPYPKFIKSPTSKNYVKDAQRHFNLALDQLVLQGYGAAIGLTPDNVKLHVPRFWNRLGITCFYLKLGSSDGLGTVFLRKSETRRGEVNEYLEKISESEHESVVDFTNYNAKRQEAIALTKTYVKQIHELLETSGPWEFLEPRLSFIDFGRKPSDAAVDQNYLFLGKEYKTGISFSSFK